VLSRKGAKAQNCLGQVRLKGEKDCNSFEFLIFNFELRNHPNRLRSGQALAMVF
jgi:hypothetical protein